MLNEGDLLWTPSKERAEKAKLTAFTRWLATERGKSFATYFHGSLSDSYNARRIINGLDHASEIAGLYKSFLIAITAAHS